MGQSLVIVESPNKMRTISKYLGKDYVVKSSRGHIRDLPTGRTLPKQKRAKPISNKLSPAAKRRKKLQKARRDQVRRMGIDPGNSWKANWVTQPDKESTIKDLKKAAESKDFVYLATDMDREGEAIAWHLQEVLGGEPQRYRRVVFNEITEQAITEAFANPGKVDVNRVNAYKTRRFLDRVVGFQLSPLLWEKVARGLSAGRVQSVAVRLVVEREREIRAFDVKEYWELVANLRQQEDCAESKESGKDGVRFKVVRQEGNPFSAKTQSDAEVAKEYLESSKFVVSKHEKKPSRTNPRAPFITSTLQQAASSRLGYSVARTMRLAQALYERGYITYMRTDSTSLSQEAVTSARKYIEKEYGLKYLPKESKTYKTKAKVAQEAHEAIRPSDVTVKSKQLIKSMGEPERKLYDLIWRRFVACQMNPAQYEGVSTTVEAGPYELTASGRTLLFDGYTKVWTVQTKKDEEQLMPSYTVGEQLDCANVESSQHFTKPPKRYREASFISELEKRGIGRPSTYSSILSTIVDRGYVLLKQKTLYAERIGEIVSDRLQESFKSLMDYEFTSKMEQNELNAIASGEKKWLQVLDGFYSEFSNQLTVAQEEMKRNDAIPVPIDCSECGKSMQIRIASQGPFLGCSGYDTSSIKERCRNTLNLVPQIEKIDSQDEEAESRVLRKKHKCPSCKTSMNGFLIDQSRRIHICGSPDCSGHEIEVGTFEMPVYEGPTIECEKCQSAMEFKTGRFGAYFLCPSESCRNTRKVMRNGEPAPPRADPVPMEELRCEGIDDHFVLRDGAAGLFLAASKYPRNRQTRAPLVQELLPHANEIDPKFKFLLTAPTKDPKGRPTKVRYFRKEREHYVRSEGKGRDWIAQYKDGKWIETDPVSTKRSSKKSIAKYKDRLSTKRDSSSSASS